MTWLNNGQSVKVPVGNYRIFFKELEGFQAPTNVVVSIKKNQTTVVDVEYLPKNNLFLEEYITTNFSNIYYVDNQTGSNSNNGLTKETPMATIQATINKTSNANTAIVLLPNSVFEGMVPNNGFIHIPSDKNLSFFGLNEGTVNSIPIIRSTDRNCIQNRSTKEINFINIRIESLGSQSINYANNYATLLQQPINNTICNFYNCYLKPRGIIFNSGSILNVYNSIIDYDKHNFVADIFWYYPGHAYSGPKKFYNSIILDTMTCRSTNSDTAIFYNSIVPSTNLSYHNFTHATNKRLATSLSTIDENWQVNLDPSFYINQGTGTNRDGSTAHIGIYGGQFALDFLKSNI